MNGSWSGRRVAFVGDAAFCVSLLGFAGAFAPKSRLSLFLRNQLFKLFSIDWIADLTAGREFSDRIELPDY